jgi:class 3 adenylate cyclase
LLRLDPRGYGVSDRDVEDMSLDAMVSDIEAVVERVGLRRLGIFANGLGSPPAIRYAARHPEMMTHLILNPAMSSGEDGQSALLDAILNLGHVDWKLAAEAGQRSFYPNAPESLIKGTAALLMASIEPQEFVRHQEQFSLWNADEDAKALKVMTLLLHNRENLSADMAVTRRVAALIPNSRIAFVEGLVADSAAIARAFYTRQEVGSGEADESRPRSETAVPEAGMAVILFADIVDSTALSEQLGDAVFRERSRTLEEQVRARITSHGGTPVAGRTLGDGVLATFAAASDAIRAALDCASAGDEVTLALHIGLHAGDVIREDANVYGQAVSIASRVSGLSAPNEVLVSATVRDLARASAGVSFEDRGERELKGVSEPVRVFAVRDALRSE